VLKTAKKADQEKKPDDPKGDFPEAHKVNYIYGGPTPMSQEGSRNPALRDHGGLTSTPEYVKWSNAPITFNHRDHSDFVPKPERYPLIVNPIVKDVKLN
jgi:hypothetical protein